MRLQVSDSVDPARWDGLITGLGGTLNHSSTYARYVLAAQPNAVAQYLTLVSDDGQPIGAALGFWARSPRRLLRPLSGRFWLASAPLVRPEASGALLEFLRRLTAHARGCGALELEVGSAASQSGGEELEELGFVLTRRLEFQLSLERSEEQLWRAMQYKRRKNIKKAARMGVTLEDMPDEQGVAELRRLQRLSGQRILARGGRDIAYKGAPARDPVGVLLEAGLARLVVARAGGEIVSAGLFTCFNGLVYHTLSGHSRKGLQTQAPTFLLWETIKRYKAKGAERFNFGGCKAEAVNEGDPEHGVYVYKMGFGGEVLHCTSGRKVLRRFARAVASVLRRAVP